MQTGVDVHAPVLALEGISKTFRAGGGAHVHAVRGASLIVGRRETVALVGESGSGKSTLARIALGLERPDSGRVLLSGHPLNEMSAQAFREARRAMQPIFQDATASLNPRRSVRDLLAQAFPDRVRGRAAEARCVPLLESVGLRPGAAYLHRRPHELSGGQCQRLALARALAAEPELVVADEPLSGADVSVRGEILYLLLDIKTARGVAYLMVTHDISVARAFADRVAVMRHGEIVECGPAAQVLTAPAHEYTRRLLQAVPSMDIAPAASPFPAPSLSMAR